MLTLVTDSTACFSRTEAQHLQLRVVPMTYVCDGRRYKESFQGENEDYLELFERSQNISTEPPLPAEFAVVFRELLDQGSEVICCPISSRLAGAYRSAQAAASAMANSAMQQVSVVDSWSTAGALEMLMRRAHSLIEQGYTRARVVDELLCLREKVHVIFSVPDMGTLRKSGRLGSLRRSLTSMFNTRPIMELSQGRVCELGSAHGSLELGRKLAAHVPESARDVLLTHCGRRTADARYTLLALKHRLPHARVRIKDGGPVLTKNVGDGAIALAWELPK